MPGHVRSRHRARQRAGEPAREPPGLPTTVYCDLAEPAGRLLRGLRWNLAASGASRNRDSDMESAAETGRRLLTIGEAAVYLGVSAASLRKWSDQGLIRVYRTPGGQRRYATADLDEFMRSMIRSTGTAKKRPRR